jgi:hypothetical protein
VRGRLSCINVNDAVRHIVDCLGAELMPMLPCECLLPVGMHIRMWISRSDTQAGCWGCMLIGRCMTICAMHDAS